MGEHLFTYSYQNQTTLHPLGLLMLVILCGAMFVVNRRSAAIPILIIACFIAPAQRIAIFGLDFSFIRIMVLGGWLRLFIKGETSGFSWKLIDKVFVAWAVSGTLTYVMLRMSGGAVIYKLGVSLDSIGTYFLFRYLIRDMEDVKHLVRWLAYLSIPVAFSLFLERQTGRNSFTIFGGVPEFTHVRFGKLRAQGAFAHAILAGCFWVSQIPLFLALWWDNGRKWFVAASVIASLVIVYSCSSSTPLAGVGMVLIGIFFYAYRHKMNLVRWSAFAILLGLHLVMKAPVWHLISRIDLVGGSTGWHRYNLINQFINKIGEWWLLGTISTAHWGWGLFDTANMYVNEGVRGGLLTLGLFLIILILSFQGVGRILKDVGETNKADYIFAWALGVSLFAHCMMFMAVSYFGQIIVVWYLLLAAIASLSPDSSPVVAAETEAVALPPRRKLIVRW